MRAFGLYILSWGLMFISHAQSVRVPFYEKHKGGYLDNSGNIITPAMYDEVYPYQEGRALFRKNSFYGFLDENGKVVIPAKYYNANPFANGIAEVTTDKNEQIFIDKNGINISLETYKSFRHVAGSIFIVRTLFNEEGLWDLTSKRIIIEPKYHEITDYESGVAVAKKQHDKRSEMMYGLVDTTGVEIVPFGHFAYISPFVNGFSRVKFYPGKDSPTDGVIDVSGNVLFELASTENIQLLSSFSEGWAKIEQNGKKGYISIDGVHTFFVDKADWVGSFRENFALVRLKNDKYYAFINKKGKTLYTDKFIPADKYVKGAPVYTESDTIGFRKGKIIVKNSKAWGFLDTLGQFTAIPFLDGVNYMDKQKDGSWIFFNEKKQGYGWMSAQGEWISQSLFPPFTTDWSQGVRNVPLTLLAEGFMRIDTENGAQIMNRNGELIYETRLNTQIGPLNTVRLIALPIRTASETHVKMRKLSIKKTEMAQEDEGNGESEWQSEEDDWMFEVEESDDSELEAKLEAEIGNGNEWNESESEWGSFSERELSMEDEEIAPGTKAPAKPSTSPNNTTVTKANARVKAPKKTKVQPKPMQQLDYVRRMTLGQTPAIIPANQKTPFSDSFELRVYPQHNVVFTGWNGQIYDGIQLMIRNHSADSVELLTYPTPNLSVVIQALSPEKEWKNITYIHGRAQIAESTLLPPNHYLEFALPHFDGDTVVMLRVALSKNGSFNDKDILVSNTWMGKINGALFTQ